MYNYNRVGWGLIFLPHVLGLSLTVSNRDFGGKTLMM